METGAQFGGSTDESGRARGLEPLAQLTEALCELGCMENAQDRLHFAMVLGDQLGRHVDVRGVRLREDVAVMVRAALAVAGGERVLAQVVEIFEGAVSVDQLDQLLARVAPPGVLGLVLGPLTVAEEESARALLTGKGEVPAGRLHDDLVEELNGLHLPTGLSPEQLFLHVLEWNAQPDGLPPAVLLLDLAAALATGAAHRTALTEWTDGWAARAGLADALVRRRAARVRQTQDPTIPRCLIVAVEPTRDGSQDIVVRSWLNAVPGHWDPQPAEPAITTLDDLGAAVEDVLRQADRLWTAPRGPDRSGREQPPYIEFVLPYDLLNHDVAGLPLHSGHDRPLPLGLKYGVHLRSLERMRTDDPLVRARWRERWRALWEGGVSVHDWSGTDVQRLDAWQTELAGEAGRTAVVLDAPAGASALEALKAAVAEGIGLAVWDRRGVFAEERREVVSAVFAAVPTPAQIPVAIHRLRRNAVMHDHVAGSLGRHIAVLWDDPNRLVDIQETDAGAAARDINDSEESGL